MKSSENKSSACECINSPLNRMNVPARASVFFTVSNLAAKACALVFTPIFTRLLTPAEYGTYSLFSSYLSVLLVLGSLELSGSVIIRVFQKYREACSLCVLVASAISVLCSTAVFAVFILIRRIIHAPALFSGAEVLLYIMMISTSLINVYISKSKFLYKWKSVLVTTLVQSLIIPILSILLINVNYFKDMNHVGLKLGVASAVMAACAVLFTVITFSSCIGELREQRSDKQQLFSSVRGICTSLLKLALPLLPYYFSVMVIAQSDRFFISEYFDRNAVAIYSVAYSLGIALNAVFSGITNSLCPWIMRKVRAGDFGKIRSTLNTLITVCILSIICFLSLASDLLSIIAPEEYTSGLPVVFIIALCPLPLSLSQVMSSVAIAKERVGGVVVSGVVPAVISVLSNAFLLQGKTVVFCAAVTALSYFLLGVIGILNTRHICLSPLIGIVKSVQKLLFLAVFARVLYILNGSFAARVAIGIAAGILLLYKLKSAAWIIKEKRGCRI